jgi:lysylphosphatidylglycerol synthetase-like protein (DUF2156 family)
VLFGLLGRTSYREGADLLARPGSPAERRELALRHGYNGMSFLTLYPGWEYFHPVAGEGFIAFERHNKVALACGDPVCEPGAAPALIEAFRTFCAAEKLTPAFVGATARLAGICREDGWKTLKVGEEPVFELADYAPRGNRTKKVRSAANQARKGGVTIECIPAGQRPPSGVAREMLEVQSAWQASRNINALAFTLRLSPLELADDKVILLARLHGRLEAFVTCIPVPARNSYYVEDMIRRPDAPNGVSEMLFLAAAGECKARGATMANLGLAPLRNARTQPDGHRALGHALQFTFSRLNLFYKFKPLEHFKAKFGPTAWEDAFLIYRPGRLNRVALALLNAFTPGKLGPLTAAASRFSRPAEAGEKRFSPGNIVGMATSAAVAVAYSALAIQHPVLFAPFAYAAQAFTFPVREAEEVARAHLIIDSAVLMLAGGWYARSARRD